MNAIGWYWLMISTKRSTLSVKCAQQLNRIIIKNGLFKWQNVHFFDKGKMWYKITLWWSTVVLQRCPTLKEILFFKCTTPTFNSLFTISLTVITIWFFFFYHVIALVAVHLVHPDRTYVWCNISSLCQFSCVVSVLEMCWFNLMFSWSSRWRGYWIV